MQAQAEKDGVESDLSSMFPKVGWHSGRLIHAGVTAWPVFETCSSGFKCRNDQQSQPGNNNHQSLYVKITVSPFIYDPRPSFVSLQLLEEPRETSSKPGSRHLQQIFPSPSLAWAEMDSSRIPPMKNETITKSNTTNKIKSVAYFYPNVKICIFGLFLPTIS